MSIPPDSKLRKAIFAAQVLSVVLIWVFVVSISIWIVNLIRLSLELNDVPGASVAISIVAIPVFVVLASVLTYVFVGLQREKDRRFTTSEEK
jgi:uncharacterized membrane protein YeiH